MQPQNEWNIECPWCGSSAWDWYDYRFFPETRTMRAWLHCDECGCEYMQVFAPSDEPVVVHDGSMDCDRVRQQIEDDRIANEIAMREEGGAR